jgi:hypothetical protein
VGDGLDKLTLLDVHGLHSKTALFLLELVVHDFLEAHALKAQQCSETFVVALEGENVVTIVAEIVHVQLMEDHVRGCSHFHGQVHCDVLVPQMAGNVDWSSTALVSLTYQL